LERRRIELFPRRDRSGARSLGTISRSLYAERGPLAVRRPPGLRGWSGTRVVGGDAAPHLLSAPIVTRRVNQNFPLTLASTVRYGTERSFASSTQNTLEEGKVHAQNEDHGSGQRRRGTCAGGPGGRRRAEGLRQELDQHHRDPGPGAREQRGRREA